MGRLIMERLIINGAPYFVEPEVYALVVGLKDENARLAVEVAAAQAMNSGMAP